jgi:hypothetical protein
MEEIWAFDVAVTTHELLKLGETCAIWVRVEVLAEGYLDASLLALQMAGCVGYTTGLWYVGGSREDDRDQKLESEAEWKSKTM